MRAASDYIKPDTHNAASKGQQVEEMFDALAPAYDFMNRAMTLGIDTRWRARAVRMIAAERPRAVLDVATGTADLAVQMARAIPDARITGIDLSEGMLSRGREKVEKAGVGSRVELLKADCLSLPMADGTYDCATIAYGARNFERLLDGYREILRVLRPGGLLCVLELSCPTSPLVRPLYNLYTRVVIPAAGRLVSGHRQAYTYLPRSIEVVPQREEMTRIMDEAGFTLTAFKPLTLGVCTIYTGCKPAAAL